MLQKIGVQAVMETSDFLKGVKEYTRGLEQSTQATNKFAGTVEGPASRGIDAFTSRMQKVGQVATDAFKGMGGAAAIATGLVITGKEMWGALVQPTINYSLAVGDLATRLQISTEEASKLYQIGDDLRISNETLATGFRKLQDQGIQPNIENLKDLIGHYAAIKDPVDRAQYAMKLFGQRAGPELQKLLTATPEQIDAIVASAEKMNLVMTSGQVEQAKRYAAAINDIGDAWQGFLTGIVGNTSVIPTAASMLEFMTRAVGGLNTVIERGGVPLLTFLQFMRDSRQEAGEAAANVAILGQDIAGLPASRSMTITADTGGADAPVAALKRSLDELFGLVEGGKKKQVFTGHGVATLTTPDLPQTFQDVRSLAGTPVTMTVDTSKAKTEVNGLKAMIDAIKSKTEIITIIHRDVYSRIQQRQAGGPVEAFTRYMVGERGREMFVPRVDGQILNHSDTERIIRAFAGSAVSSRALRSMQMAAGTVLAPAVTRTGGDTYQTYDQRDQRAVNVGQMGADLTNPFAVKRILDDYFGRA